MYYDINSTEVKKATVSTALRIIADLNLKDEVLYEVLKVLEGHNKAIAKKLEEQQEGMVD